MMANIQSLPNELLEDILDIACGDQLLTTHRQQLQLSHVNQRFREIITNNARLWSYITLKSTVEWVELLLRRSGSHGLIIDMSTHHNLTETKRCSYKAMLSQVVRHKDRWEEVRFGASFGSGLRIVHLSNITLPSLVRLIFPEDIKVCSLDGGLCLSWKIPALEHMRCSEDANFVPHILPNPLKSLRYTDYCNRPAEVIILHRLMEARGVVGVEELTLRLKSPLKRRADVVYNSVHIKNLRSFTVDFTTTTPNEVAETFFEYLDLPALKVFEFKHDRSEAFSTDNSSDDDLLRPYLHGLNWLLVDYRNIRTRFPKLKEVRITIDGVEDKKLCDELRDKLEEKFRIEWFGGDLGVTGEEEYAEFVATCKCAAGSHPDTPKT